MDVRDQIIDALAREIVGPSPNPHYLDPVTGEEILLARVHGSPKSRYGAGMLYPQSSLNKEETDSGELESFAFPEDSLENRPTEETDSEKRSTELDFEEPVGLANQFLPSAMGFTARFNSNEKNDLVTLHIKSAYYIKGKDKTPVRKNFGEAKIESIKYKDSELLSEYWTRCPLKIDSIPLHLNSLFIANSRQFSKIVAQLAGKDWLKLQIFDRTTAQDKKEGYNTYTFVLINTIRATTDDAVNNNSILFQNELQLSTDNPQLIVPYREKLSSTDTDEERELNLLYRKKRVFAIGHGVSVNWNTITEKEVERVNIIKTSVLPVYEIPQVAPTGNVELSMLELSDVKQWKKVAESLALLVNEYNKWIEEIADMASSLPELEDYREAAKRNVEKCRTTLKRIAKGVELISNSEENSAIRKSFAWMNRAMLWQQQRSKVTQRKWRKTGKEPNETFVLDPIEKEITEFPSLEDFHNASRFNGRWRPFQLAFVLMNIESIVNPDSDDRNIVDLIWFPTGGGKTEAYLGLSAFTIFYRRLKGKEKYNWDFYGGTTILMRYTLRLLTTQQYERASSLICACDIIRKENLKDLGDEPISIGLWVGGSSTPNDNSTARTQFNQLTGKEKSTHISYNFIVMKCPCCGAQIGKLDSPSRKEKLKGLRKEDGPNGRVLFQCDNLTCEYNKTPLPLYVVDDNIYENPPTLVLGTVDKFAMIPWKTEAGNLFGFREKNDNWTRILPPELIVQDELHLIAGPLGTLVGLYETMIQTLCNNYAIESPPFLPGGESSFVAPKIVASSATISRAYEQVKNLYGIDSRDKLHIFPSQGLEFGNTWFSEEKSILEKNEKGDFAYPGRKYVGILASGYPSAQTAIVRSYSSVLQKVKELESTPDIDFYWTLMGYFNSIRELGGASSLVFGDIKERLSQIQNRDLLDKTQKRYVNKTEELTSRISSFEIPEILKKLEEKHKQMSTKALDICLATNMLATGVDISRLGLMFIHGQPKSTAEYIQASSRVGRKVPDGPGLIFTLYSPSKPRDKSQYEQFQGYHSRIYSNVEPTSVTPFSVIAREKALHAILFGMIRQFAAKDLRKNPQTNNEFEELCSKIKSLILNRCHIIDNDELQNTARLIERRIAFWKKGFQNYGDAGNFGILKDSGFIPLFYSTSAEVREEIVRENRSLATPTSMRGVDTESVVNVYSNNEIDVEE